MKRIISVFVCVAAIVSLTFSLAACGNGGSGKSSEKYVVRAVNVYRDVGTADKTMDVRFYDSAPNVPCVSVSGFYKEFFKADLTLEKSGNVYKYTIKDGKYMKFDVKEDVFVVRGLAAFSEHPDFVAANTKFFLEEIETINTVSSERAVSLANYGIDAHGDTEAYVPLTFLATLSGGAAGYNIAYNGRDIFVLDTRGQLFDVPHDANYYGDNYFGPLNDLETPRAADLIDYNYGQLCFNFDNLRGYTDQMLFIDNNLLSLGLNGLIEYYYPKLKEMLLSSDKLTYYTGYFFLMAGLYDGGHTGTDMVEKDFLAAAVDTLRDYNELIPIMSKYSSAIKKLVSDQTVYGTSKAAAFPEYTSGINMYHFDEATKTAYISFDSFNIDFRSWDNYFANDMDEAFLPEESYDTFIFVRNSLYRALEDDAVNAVLDLSTNTGGNSGALVGVVGLLNNAKAELSMNFTFDKTRNTNRCGIDIDLNGVFDENDVAEAEKFTALNIGVLTSPLAFSCGNLLPSMLKELGYKIIGQKSGGGSCAITFESTAEGITYYRSSSSCLSNMSGENIDRGVMPDLIIPLIETDEPDVLQAAHFYDFTTIADYFASLTE